LNTSNTSLDAARASLGYLVLSGLLWGTGGLIGTLLARGAGLGAPAVATYRLGIGGLLLLLVLLHRHRRSATSEPRWPTARSAWTRVGLFGLLAALFQTCYFGAVALTSVSLATLVTIGTTPILVLIIEHLTGRQRADRGAVGVVAVALTGLGLLIGVPSGDHTPTAVLGSAILAVLASAGFAGVTLLGARPVPTLDDLTSTGFGFTIGALILVPFAQVTTGLGMHVTLPSIGLLLALGAVPTALAYTLYFKGLRHSTAGTAVVVALLEPLTGAILATLLLGDRLGPAGVVGGVLLAIAVVLAGRKRGPSTSPSLEASVQ
jgi:drug/metabolite transporter, DME family